MRSRSATSGDPFGDDILDEGDAADADATG